LQSTMAACFPIVLIVTTVLLVVDLLRVVRAGERQGSFAGIGAKGPVSV
jgi:hypothetical protein